MNVERSLRYHAMRVAASAVAVVLAVYVLGVVFVDIAVVHHLVSEADQRLVSHLAEAGRLEIGGAGGGDLAHPDPDETPVFVWSVSDTGGATALTQNAPALPHRDWASAPLTVTIGGTPFRFAAVRQGGGWLVDAESVSHIYDVQHALVAPEVLVGLVLVVAVFGGALVVGLRASAPLALIRRRQAEFTADASHELRTPLSVIEAEVNVALQRARTPGEYVEVLERITGESARLRRIVEDLLWLARADDAPLDAARAGQVDVAEVVATSAKRFGSVAEDRGITLTSERSGDEPATVRADAELVDRLAGVLVDNACKYAGEGGSVSVEVRTGGHRVRLVVGDSGPGIPESERGAIFDRFHRATSSADGSGLGLAIADAIVRRTGATWSVGTSPLGGARMEVVWRSARSTAPPKG